MPQSLNHISDQELLDRFYAKRDPGLLGSLLERYTLILFGVGMKYLRSEELAKDMVQQVFLKALSEIPKYRIDNIGGWLYRVAKNQCLSDLREHRRVADQEVPVHLVQPDEPDEMALWQQEHTLTQLKLAVLTLRPEQRLCITLFYFEQRTYQEISDQTGFDLKQVKSHIQNGKRNLRLKLAAKITDRR